VPTSIDRQVIVCGECHNEQETLLAGMKISHTFAGQVMEKEEESLK